MNKLRWGILGAANIARQNWKSIHNSGNSVVAAVASRNPDRTRRFIQECQAEAPFESAPTPHASYAELLASKDVDAVYIPLPTGVRREWVLRAAAAGKHVLCEKPCGVSAAEVLEMTEACRLQGVQFMDGVMFMHNPRMARMREALDDASRFGEIKRITSFFSFHMGEEAFDTNIRLNSQLEPSGCLGDLGWYCIRYTLWAMQWQMPRESTGRILAARGGSRSPAPVPFEFSGQLLFDSGVSAGFYCSFCARSQDWVNVAGTRGSLHVADFVHPKNDHEPEFRLNDTEIRVKHCDCSGPHTASQASSQRAAMIRNFANQARSGQLNPQWPEIALKTQQVLDACLESARQKA